MAHHHHHHQHPTDPHAHIPLLQHLHLNTSAGAERERWIGAVEDAWIMYSDDPSDYTLSQPIGYGASSIVYRAIYRPSPPSSSSSSSSSSHPRSSTPTPPVECAIKVINLDSLPPAPLALLTRETRLMSLSKHPNVLRVRGSWVQGHKLCIAMRLMRKGSVGDLIRYAWQGGMPEEVCKCVLRQALEGLNYLHTNGFIHRDVKAANLLIDDDGTVLLGDLGVAASVLDDAQAVAGVKRRRSFVGTPSWMAPEVVGRQAYDSSADIWSFGILALEMTSGRAPGSRDPPNKILLKTLQNKPPTLDREGGPYKYSKAFEGVVQGCLQKDPTLRPTAAQLLQTPFFKSAKRKAYLVSAVLEGLPPIERRLERRRANSIPSILSSSSSWDFSHTHVSGSGGGKRESTASYQSQSQSQSPARSSSSLRKRYSWDGTAGRGLTGVDDSCVPDGLGLGILRRDESAVEESSDEEEEEGGGEWTRRTTPQEQDRLAPITPSEGSGSGSRTPMQTVALSREGSKSEGQAGAGAQGLLGKFRRLSSSGGREKEREREREGNGRERGTVVGFLRQVSGTGAKR